MKKYLMVDVPEGLSLDLSIMAYDDKDTAYCLGLKEFTPPSVNNDKQGDDNGFIIGVVSAAAIIFLILWLAGCAPVKETLDAPMYMAGGIYQENDTIVNDDSLTYWTR